MPTAETLRALLAKVEEAKAGSRELDAELWWALDGEPLRGRETFREDASVLGVVAALDERFHVGWRRINLVPPPLTTSIDAALALIAKVLPRSRPHDVLHDAIERMNLAGWRADVPQTPQLALHVIAEMLGRIMPWEEAAHVER